MNVKEHLTEMIRKQESELKTLEERANSTQDVEELRSLTATINEIRKDVENSRSVLAELDKPAEEQRGGFDPAKTFTTLEHFKNDQERGVDVLASDEYRNDFMTFCRTGNKSDLIRNMESRASGVVANLGVMIPQTVIDKIITGIEKGYGSLYNRVRHYNVIGGLSVPIGEEDVVANRQAEGTSGTATKGYQITGSVVFGYKILEIKVAESILRAIIGGTVNAFEEKLAQAIVRAYLKKMDHEIMEGDGSSEMEGILTDARLNGSGRIKTTQVITFTDAEITDWKKWQEKVFAVLPIEMENAGLELVMTKGTYEGTIKTISDTSNRPLYSELPNSAGRQNKFFNGFPVLEIQTDLGLKNFSTAENDDYFAMLWVPEMAYGINTNQEFYQKRYNDEDKNEIVQKALTVNDGKILDPAYIYLLKKSVGA